MSERIETHIKIGRYLKDIIFAANDGIITTFAVIAGVVGANFSSAVVLIIGVASLIADGFSMATGNYLGTKSEQNFYDYEEAEEKKEVMESREEEINEVREILEKKGYAGEELEKLTNLIISNEKFWIDFMMHEELGLIKSDEESPAKRSLATFLSFITAGVLPLFPYIMFKNSEETFAIAAVFAGIALFAVGALRTFFSHRSWLVSGIEMLLVGGSAGTIAYFVGFILKSITG